jgi:hypothetical protein
MAKPAHEVFDDYLAAQATGDIEEVMQYIAPNAVFDVGRGRYTGEEIRQFHERLFDIQSATNAVEIEEEAPERLTAILDQSDDDLRQLGIDKIQLQADIVTNGDRIQMFTARPNPASLAILAAARDAGQTSKGIELAEQAGTLPPRLETDPGGQ